MRKGTVSRCYVANYCRGVLLRRLGSHQSSPLRMQKNVHFAGPLDDDSPARGPSQNHEAVWQENRRSEARKVALFLTKSRNFRIFRKKKMWCGFTCFFKKPTPPKSQKNGKNDLFWRGRFFEKTGETRAHFFFRKIPKISWFCQKKYLFPRLRTAILLSDCLVNFGCAPCRGFVIQGTSKVHIFFTKIRFFAQFGQEFTSKMAKNL